MSAEIDPPVYLDHHATTPVDDRVVAAMEPYFSEVYGNPASRDDHAFGNEAYQAVETAREQVADVINARSEEIIFTSGATESDNLAVRGTMEYARKNDDGTHLITAPTEHEAVLEVAQELETEGFDVTVVPVDEYGRVDPADVQTAIRDDTVLISIMAANNEIGTLAPLERFGAIAKDAGVIFHTDAVQAVGYRDLDVQALGVDLMSISGHKIYGPKGVGALYVRRRRPKVHMKPLLYGGGHERGWRSGTLNVPGIVGLGEAVELAEAEREDRVERVSALRDQLWDELQATLDDVELNGHPDERLPNNLNVSFHGVDNKALVHKLDPEIIAAAGAACSTMETEASHVLEAITDDESRLNSALRFGLGKENTSAEIEYTAEQVVEQVSRLRRISFS